MVIGCSRLTSLRGPLSYKGIYLRKLACLRLSMYSIGLPREAGGRRDARSDTGRSLRYLRTGTLCGSPAVPECPAAPIAARSPRISSYNSRSFQLPVRVPSACRRPQPSVCPPQFLNPMFIASSRRTVRLTLTCIFSSPTVL